MLVSEEVLKEMKEKAERAAMTPEQQLQAQRDLAIKTLYINQECYVAQWILMNPYVNPEEYALKFIWNDQELSGYSVTMEKIKNV